MSSSNSNRAYKKWTTDYCRVVAFYHVPATARNRDVPLWLRTYRGTVPIYAIKKIQALHATDIELAEWREDQSRIRHDMLNPN